MKIFLFGGTGFVSKSILCQAVEKGHEITYLTRGIRPTQTYSNVKHVCADRDKYESNLIDLLNNKQFDIIIDAICKTNAHAKQAIEFSKSCKRLVMISTDYVYDPFRRILNQSEKDASYAEGDTYGAKKRKAELEIIEAYETGLTNAIILRTPHIYGPGSKPGTIPKHGRSDSLIDDIGVKGKTLSLLQGGLGLIQPIYVEDLSRLILQIMNKTEAYNSVYNCSGPELMTHLDYYKEIAKNLERELKTEPYYFNKEDFNPFPSGHRYYDNSKLKQMMPGFEWTEFQEGMKVWVKHLKSQ